VRVRSFARVFERKYESLSGHVDDEFSGSERLALVGIKHRAISGLPGRKLGGYQGDGRRGGCGL